MLVQSFHQLPLKDAENNCNDSQSPSPELDFMHQRLDGPRELTIHPMLMLAFLLELLFNETLEYISRIFGDIICLQHRANLSAY